MDKPVEAAEHKVSRRAHLKQAYKGELPDQYVGPRLPIEVAHVWDWYERLNRQREDGMVRQAPILYREIDAFCRLMRIEMQPWEVDAITMMDVASRATFADKSDDPPEWESQEDDDDED